MGTFLGSIRSGTFLHQGLFILGMMTPAVVFGQSSHPTNVLSVPQWHEFPITSTMSETVGPESFEVKNRQDEAGIASARSVIRVQPDRDRLQLEVELELTSNVDSIPFRFYLEVSDINSGEVVWKSDRQVNASDRRVQTWRPLFRKTFYSDEMESIRRGEKRILLIQHPVEWWGRRDHAPGPLVRDTQRSHIFVLPGLLGAGSDLQRISRTLESTADAQGQMMSVQLWDWTRFWEQPKSLQDKILIVEQTQEIGRKFALNVAQWRKDNSTAEDVSLMALSAGTMIAAMACEAKDDHGQYILPEKVFKRVIFMSGALSMFYDFSHLNRCTEQMYNYYSDKDDILTIAFPRIFLFFELPVSVSWPAIGRFGLNQDLPNFQFITKQLPFIRKSYGGDAESLGNSGRHLNPGCLSSKYFSKYFIPLLNGTPLPALWQKPTHPLYDQDQRHKVGP